MSDWIMTWPEWLRYLVAGVTLALQMSFCAVVAARAGRNPYWGLLGVVPFALVPAVWALAYIRWPKIDG